MCKDKTHRYKTCEFFCFKFVFLRNLIEDSSFQEIFLIMGKTAIILGATGLTGNILLQKLLEDRRYGLIKLFSRNPIGIQHPKIIELLGNLIDLKSYKKDFIADEVFCCIGTTSKKTPDKELYKKIDFGIPVMAAKLCEENEINTFLVISSIGANSKSAVFYNKTKGEMEEVILKENIKNTYILRPSIILGKRKENRMAERIGKTLFSIFQFVLVGKFKKYRVIEANKIARSMIYLANTKPNISIIESDMIEEIASRNV